MQNKPDREKPGLVKPDVVKPSNYINNNNILNNNNDKYDKYSGLEDFEIFNDQTLAGRMHLIKTVIDPKFEQVAPTIIASLQTPSEPPFYAHVAKHLRRFKNPPVDTWVAFSQNKRSYKAWPHFELGLWPDRLFIYFDILDECKPDT